MYQRVMNVFKQQVVSSQKDDSAYPFQPQPHWTSVERGIMQTLREKSLKQDLNINVPGLDTFQEHFLPMICKVENDD